VQRWLALWTNLDDDNDENNIDDDNPTDSEQSDLLEIADFKTSSGKRRQAKSRHRRDWARWRSTDPKQPDPLDTLTDLEQPDLQETDDLETEADSEPTRPDETNQTPGTDEHNRMSRKEEHKLTPRNAKRTL
jgi:hypothetical protein